MKSAILTFSSLLLAFVSMGQVTFQEKGKPLAVLNNNYGQNYLMLNPEDSSFAFTESRGGKADSDAYEKRTVETYHIHRFIDWLGTNGMSSPIGFYGQELYYNVVTYLQGAYQGSIKKLDLNTGKKSTVKVPFFKNKSSLQSGCLSADGRYMILSMESAHTYGVEDLYLIARRPNGSWSKPKNLGATLNTVYQEVTPFLAEDNRTLFFATNGREGQGSFDLFYAVRQDDSWRNWSSPVNLGTQVNTSGAETSFVFIDGATTAYYISSQDSDAYGDIMQIAFSENIEEEKLEITEDTVLVIPPISTADTLYSSMGLQVVDAATKEPIAAELIIDDHTIVNEGGRFDLQSVVANEVEVKSLGYLPKVLDLKDKITELITVTLVPVKKGSIVTLNNVLFHRGTSDMMEGAKQELDLVVEVMDDNPNIKILLKGHTDNTGDPVRNVRLSEARVKAVKAYLVSQGISAYRVSGKGYGGNQPVYSNKTEETRKLNRRVAFEVLDD